MNIFSSFNRTLGIIEAPKPPTPRWYGILWHDGEHSAVLCPACATRFDCGEIAALDKIPFDRRCAACNKQPKVEE